MTVLGTTLLCVGCGVAAFFLYQGWAVLDRKEEKRRTAFNKLSTTLRAYGLVRLPDLLDCYVVGDYSGFFVKLHKFADMLDDGDEVVVKDFDGVFTKVLDTKLATAEGRAYIKAHLAAAEPAVVAAA